MATWIIHTLAFTDDERVDDMRQAIRDRGSRIIEIEGAFGQYDLSETMQVGGCLGPTIAYGSCNFMKFVTSRASWVPGHWCDWQKLKCSSYMSKLAPHSIHMWYAYMPFGELMHNKDVIFRVYGDQRERDFKKSCVFIRPDGNDKPFHGQVVHFNNFDAWYREHQDAWKIPDTMLCMISMPDHIQAEWRLFIHRGKVISGSQYRPEWTADYDPFVNEYAERVIREADFSPFPLFALDLALTKHGVHSIIEYGSINCAGLYAAPVEPLVAAAEEEALIEYEDCYGPAT
jgi:hypothetical protein